VCFFNSLPKRAFCDALHFPCSEQPLELGGARLIELGDIPLQLLQYPFKPSQVLIRGILDGLEVLLVDRK
jgi:hypothetical protein